MRIDLFIIAGLILLVSCVLLFIALHFVNKEHKKQLREIVDKTRTDWAKALDSVEKLCNKEADALRYALLTKDDLLAEKNRRIEDLEAQISLNNLVMACAKVDGSIDATTLVKLIETENGKKDYERVLNNLSKFGGDAE